LPDGTVTKLPKFPLEYQDANYEVYQNPPQIGEHTQAILMNLGMTEGEIEILRNKQIIK
jgi:crotonobetainyl-CoA:carnitine CoA-transferase CaiB-like acyl-CoA transferase